MKPAALPQLRVLVSARSARARVARLVEHVEAVHGAMVCAIT